MKRKHQLEAVVHNLTIQFETIENKSAIQETQFM
jgi:hypothetical protein